MDITTEKLQDYKINFERSLDTLKINIEYGGTSEFNCISDANYRDARSFKLSDVVRKFNALQKLVQNDYNKRLFLTYVNDVGIIGFDALGTNRNFRKYLKNFDILTILNNPLVDCENIRHNSTKSPLKMGVGKYHNYTRAYVVSSDFENDVKMIGYNQTSYHTSDIGHVSLNGFMTLNRDFNFTYLSNGKMLHDGQRTERKTFIGCPTDDDIQYVSAYVIRATNLIPCGDCGVFCKSQHVNTYNVCKSCQADEIKYHIHDYGYKPNPRFFRLANGQPMGFLNAHFHKNTYFGYEIETNIKREYRHEINQIVDKIIRSTEINGKALFYAKYDSSLGERGVEFVSHPMTYKCFNKIDWDEMFAKFRSMLSSYSDDRCGIHIHMSRNFMSDYTMAKFMHLMYENPQFTELIAQRSSNDWAEIDYNDIKRFMISSCENKENTSANYEKFIKANFGDRYKALNFQNSATVECRIFKGNLKSDRLKKNIEYLMAMKEFCQVTSYSNINVKNFVGFVKSNFKSYMNLNRFLNQFNKSLNQIINGGK